MLANLIYVKPLLGDSIRGVMVRGACPSLLDSFSLLAIVIDLLLSSSSPPLLSGLVLGLRRVPTR